MIKYEHLKLLLVLNVIAVIMYNIVNIIRSETAIPIILSIFIIAGDMCLLFVVLRHKKIEDSQ